MQTLTYGLKRPQNGDVGGTVFPAMQDNITQLDAHSHDGVTSPKLTAASSTAVTASVLSAAWVATSDGNYRQAVTLPAALSYDTTQIAMKVLNNQVFAKIEKISASQFYVYTNDNATAFTAVYTT